MSELNYYKAVIKVAYEDAKGRPKFRKEEYIVHAISPTDVESIVTKEMEGTDFEISSIVLTKILDILGK